MKYELHPACAAWPPMSEKELSELEEDIRINGLLEPITLTPDGLLLDGRNREMICEKLGIEAATIIHDGDPISYSLSKNKHRRHLDKVDLAFIAAELATLKNGTNQYQEKVGTANAVPTNAAQSRAQVAEELGIPLSSVESAKAIKEKGSEGIINLVKTKKVGLRTAADYVRRTPKDQQKADPEVIKSKPEKVEPEKVEPDMKNDMRRGGPKLDQARQIIRPLLESGQTINRQKLEEEHGISHTTFDMAIATELGYREGYREGHEAGLKAADINPSILGTTYKAKYETLVKYHEEAFERIVEQRVQQGIAAHLNSVVWQIYKKRFDDADAVLKNRPPFTREEFALLRKALHPDSAYEELQNAAIDMINKKQHLLRPGADKNDGFMGGLPGSVEDLLARKYAKRTAH